MKESLPRRIRGQHEYAGRCSLPAIVQSVFRPGTEVGGRPGPSWARTSTAADGHEPGRARCEPALRAASFRIRTAAAAPFRRHLAQPSMAEPWRCSQSRSLARCRHRRSPGCARAHPRRSRGAARPPRQAGESRREKNPSACQRLRLDGCSNAPESTLPMKAIDAIRRSNHCIHAPLHVSGHAACSRSAGLLTARNDTRSCEQ